MNYEQMMAIFRTLLQMGGAVMVSRGVIGANEFATLTDSLTVGIGAILSIGTIAWGVWARTDKNLVKSAVEVAVRKPEVAEKELTPVAERIARNNRYS